MAVSGGAVSPENRSNEDPDVEMTYRLANEHPFIMDRLAAVERERDELRADVKIRDAEITRQHGIILALDNDADQALIDRDEAIEAESEAGDRIKLERDAALARIAVVEAKLKPSALFDALYDAMYGAASVNDEEREAVAQLAESLGAALEASPTQPAIGELAAQQSKMISGSYPADLSDEAHMWRRCAKAGEEHGEVIEALLGFVGENPRKGVTADREKVIKELLDEAFAALGAVEYLRGNDGSSGRLLAEHAQFVTGRLRAALAASPTPTGPEPAKCEHACVERWAECRDGDYNPACCRFPKSCSCGVPATPTEPTEETPVNAGHTRRAHFSCEEGSECRDDCLDGYVCDQCTDAEDRPVWWPCVAAAGPGGADPKAPDLCPECNGSGNGATFDGIDLGVCPRCEGDGLDPKETRP